MMQRREFLKRCALIAAGVVAADQLDLLEMLAPRRLFPGADFGEMNVGIGEVLYSTSIHSLNWDQHGRLWTASWSPSNPRPKGTYQVVVS